MERAEVTQNPSRMIIYRYEVGNPTERKVPEQLSINCVQRLESISLILTHIVLCQVVHAASVGDRATVLSKSKDLKFLTGFEAKVRAFRLFCRSAYSLLI